VVSTPGDRWFSLEIDGGFSSDHLEEETPDSEVMERLGVYVDLASDYVEKGAQVLSSSGLGRHSVRLTRTSGDEIVLRRSFGAQFRAAIKRGTRSND
jgi:hypothetical protein